jgi:transposase-like protein
MSSRDGRPPQPECRRAGVVEQLGIAGMSKSQVSRMCAALDEQVSAFRQRPLEGRYPYLWLDAKVEKVRDPDGRVRRKALVVAYAVHEQGYSEVDRARVGATESGAVWRQFLREVIVRLASVAPKVAALLTEAEDDLLAFYAMPPEHWSKLRSTIPLEWVNREMAGDRTRRWVAVACRGWSSGTRSAHARALNSL